MSIRLKLTLYWMAVLGAILIAAGLVAFALFQRRQWGVLDAALLEEADTSASVIAHLEPAAVAATVRRLSEERDLGAERRVRLLTAAGVLADFGERAADLPPSSARGPRPTLTDGERRIFRYAIVPFALAGGTAYLEDGVDASALRTAAARLRATLLLVIALMLMLCAAGGYWLAGRALKPITSITAALGQTDPRDFGRRLIPPQAADEVGRLSTAINALLDRIERASALERRFASDAAHELRTPLSVLRTGLEVALSRPRSAEDSRAALEGALREVVGLCEMAEDLLALARLEGDNALACVPLDLHALLDDAVATVRPLAQTRNIELTVDGGGGAPVKGDPGHLKRLLLNLLDNALKFTPEHGLVKVSLQCRDGRAVLRVADSGPGIPAAEIALIFERFYRGRAQRGAGSGLGLSLAREIVRLHGGEIRAGAAPEGGTEFIVTLRLCGNLDFTLSEQSSRSEKSQ